MLYSILCISHMLIPDKCYRSRVCEKTYHLSTYTSFEKISIENSGNFFKVNVFTYVDKAIIKPSCCEVSCP